MEGYADPQDVRLVLILLRALHNWTQDDLAAHTGIARQNISDYETGKVSPTRLTLEAIAAAASVPFFLIRQLLAMCRNLRAVSNVARRLVAGAPTDAIETSARAIAGVVETTAAAVIAKLDQAVSSLSPGKETAPTAAQRERAGELWDRLRKAPEEHWPALASGAQEYQDWTLCELLCAESERVAADDPARALLLAKVAILIAEAAPGTEAWRARLQGYAYAHLANALRVAGDLPASSQAFATAWRLWKAGDGAPDLLDATRMLDLYASLRRAERRFRESLTLLEGALAQAPDNENAARLLLKKAFAQEQQGDHAAAIATLDQAAPLAEASIDPRLCFAHRFNLAVNLLHAARPSEAAALLPDVRERAFQLGNSLDLLRVGWLESRVAVGLGDRAEGVAKLEEVHRAFAERGSPYDTALAALELAALYLEEGRTADVRPLAAATEAVLRAQRVRREALAAAWLFCEAAARDAVTLQLVRHWAGQLAG